MCTCVRSSERHARVWSRRQICLQQQFRLITAWPLTSMCSEGSEPGTSVTLLRSQWNVRGRSPTATHVVATISPRFTELGKENESTLGAPASNNDNEFLHQKHTEQFTTASDFSRRFPLARHFTDAQYVTLLQALFGCKLLELIAELASRLNSLFYAHAQIRLRKTIIHVHKLHWL